MKPEDRDEILRYSAAMSELAAERSYRIEIMLRISIVMNVISLLVQVFQ